MATYFCRESTLVHVSTEGLRSGCNLHLPAVQMGVLDLYLESWGQDGDRTRGVNERDKEARVVWRCCLPLRSGSGDSDLHT